MSWNFSITYSFIVFCVFGAVLSAGEGAVVVSPLLKPLPDGSQQRLCLSLESLPIWCCPSLIPSAHSALIFHPVKTLKSSSHAFVPLLSSVGGLLPGFLLWTPKLYKETPSPPPLHEEWHRKGNAGGHENSVSTPSSYLGQDQAGEPSFPSEPFSSLLSFHFSGVECLREENRFEHVSEVLGG